jgi:hypothetical protein
LNKITLLVIPIIFSSNVLAHEAKQLIHFHQNDYLAATIIAFILLGVYKTLKLAIKNGGSNV